MGWGGRAGGRAREGGGGALAGARAGGGARGPASAPATQVPARSPAPALGESPAARPAEMVPLRYGYAATSLVFIVMKVAVEQGFYRQYGLAVEPVLMAPNVTAPAQLSG